MNTAKEKAILEDNLMLSANKTVLHEQILLFIY